MRTPGPVADDEVAAETKGLIWEGLEFQGKRPDLVLDALEMLPGP